MLGTLIFPCRRRAPLHSVAAVQFLIESRKGGTFQSDIETDVCKGQSDSECRMTMEYHQQNYRSWATALSSFPAFLLFRKYQWNQSLVKGAGAQRNTISSGLPRNFHHPGQDLSLMNPGQSRLFESFASENVSRYDGQMWSTENRRSCQRGIKKWHVLSGRQVQFYVLISATVQQLSSSRLAGDA